MTGLHYFNQKEGEFQFREGPVFTQILLADEINRATPRTQSSLLECMEERQVTIDGETRKLDEVFFVIATQNPDRELRYVSASRGPDGPFLHEAFHGLSE